MSLQKSDVKLEYLQGTLAAVKNNLHNLLALKVTNA